MNCTFLEEKQIFSGNGTVSKPLEIFNKIGTKAAITDFSILLGGYVSDDFTVNDSGKLEDRTGWYWTKTDDGDNDARVVEVAGRSD